MAQERRGVVRLEIADGRAGKEAGPRQTGDCRRQTERLGEIGRDRQHREARIVARSSAASCASISDEMSTGT